MSILAAMMITPAIAGVAPGDDIGVLGEYGAVVGLIFLLLEVAKRLLDKIPVLRDSGSARLETAIRDHQERADAGFTAVQETLHRLEDQVIDRVSDMTPLLNELVKTGAVQQKLMEQMAANHQQTSTAIIVLSEILKNKGC